MCPLKSISGFLMVLFHVGCEILVAVALLTVGSAGARLRAFAWVTRRPSESPVLSTGALKHC